MGVKSELLETPKAIYTSVRDGVLARMKQVEEGGQ